MFLRGCDDVRRQNISKVLLCLMTNLNKQLFKKKEENNNRCGKVSRPAVFLNAY